MVMGPTHAISGAAAWLAVAPPVTQIVTGHAMEPSQALVGAAVCAGSALLPDIDLPSSTVSRSFGPLTQALSYGVNGASKAFVVATCSHRDQVEAGEFGGHRKLTHTALFAVALGMGVSALCGAFGRYAVVGVLFFTLGLAIRGLMGDWAKEQGWLGVTVTSFVVAAVCSQVLPTSGWWILGFAVTMGCFVHVVGDMITRQGAPLGAPFYKNRATQKRWYELTTRPFSIRAGGPFEYAIINPLCWAAAILALISIFFPGAISQAISNLLNYA